MKLSTLILYTVTASLGFAQSGAILTATGYSAQKPLQIAPGQVTTLFFRDIGPSPDGQLRAAQAGAAPLPTQLAGISLSITQEPGNAVAIPIFAVRQERDCDLASASGSPCLLTMIRIQAPYEIAAEAQHSAGSGPPTSPVPPAPLAELKIEVDGHTGRTFLLQPVPDDAHILTSCDLSWDTSYTSICDRHVYHADGRLVSASEPARPGENIVVYAYGLGKCFWQLHLAHFGGLIWPTLSC